MEERIRLMKDWEQRYRTPDGRLRRGDIAKIGDLALIDANIDAVFDIRERLMDGIMIQQMCQEASLDAEKKVTVA